jgi:hypothetical protein
MDGRERIPYSVLVGETEGKRQLFLHIVEGLVLKWILEK